MANKNASDLKFCGCRSCRAGRRHNTAIVRRARRSLRRAVKADCRRAMVDPFADISVRVSVPYTD